MANINVTVIAGNLVRDPIIKRVANGVVVANFTLAANHFYKDREGKMKEETAFVPCVTFARQAERVAERRKGQPLCASGYLRTDSWEQDGTTSSRLVLICAEVQALASYPSTKNLEGDPLPSAVTPDSEHPPF